MNVVPVKGSKRNGAEKGRARARKRERERGGRREKKRRWIAEERKEERQKKKGSRSLAGKRKRKAGLSNVAHRHAREILLLVSAERERSGGHARNPSDLAPVTRKESKSKQ